MKQSKAAAGTGSRQVTGPIGIDGKRLLGRILCIIDSGISGSIDHHLRIKLLEALLNDIGVRNIALCSSQPRDGHFTGRRRHQGAPQLTAGPKDQRSRRFHKRASSHATYRAITSSDSGS